VAGYNLGGVYTYTYGSVIISSNNPISFTPQANTLAPGYLPCSHNQSVCAPVTGTLNETVGVLQNKVLGPPYSANLTIYINPAGYYEYIIQNSTLGSNPKTKLSTSSYLNKLPSQLNNNITLSLFSSINFSISTNSNTVYYSKNSSIAEIYYSSLIDLSPLEYDMLGGNLTPHTFADFVYTNVESFQNTTVIYNISLYSAKSALQSSQTLGYLQNFVNAGFTTIFCTNPIFIGTCTGQLLTTGTITSPVTIKGIAQIPFAEVSTPAELSIPTMLATIPNSSISFPMYVSYAYPNTLCQIKELTISGICIESGQKGMLDFNNYVDAVYAPQILMNIFLTVDATLILGFALIILIVKKINGE
jgi:hypothetical protein